MENPLKLQLCRKVSLSRSRGWCESGPCPRPWEGAKRWAVGSERSGGAVGFSGRFFMRNDPFPFQNINIYKIIKVQDFIVIMYNY